MTKEDILQALRLTAMGRYGHDLQVQLAEKLELLFLESGAVAIANAEQRVAEKLAEVPKATFEKVAIVHARETAPRGPRAKKAD